MFGVSKFYASAAAIYTVATAVATVALLSLPAAAQSGRAQVVVARADRVPSQPAARFQARLRGRENVRYKLIDLGTFGGPASFISNGFDGILNDNGEAAGSANTNAPDPYPAFCFSNCFVTHAFATRDGKLADLGVLPGGASSTAVWIAADGLISGVSQNGQTDPLFAGFPENRAVLWIGGHITDLGTMEGGYESYSNANNTGGQVAGFVFNSIPDSFSLAAPGFYPTQTRAFLWQNGVMQDLGTLGGSDANAIAINARGQVAGDSYTNTTPNPVVDLCGGGEGVPTEDPFLWQGGRMTDLGTLGGTCGQVAGMNDRGQIIGLSDMADDLTYHPFLWEQGVLFDLGTLGGQNGLTNWINGDGDVAGKADLPGPLPQNHDGVLWTGGMKIDLGVLPGDSCSNAYYVNRLGQVVGTSENRTLCLIPAGQHAFLWEHGGPMIDLNTLIPTGSSLQLTFAFAIDDRGEIVGAGLPNGCTRLLACGHAYVLVPCNGDDPREDCREVQEDASHGQSQSITTRSTMVPSRIPWLRCRRASCAGLGG